MSKFNLKEDHEGLIYRRTRKEGIPFEIEMGIYPVIFGYRIRVGIVGSWTYNLDYCAGNQLKEVENIYSLTLAALDKLIDENKNVSFWGKIFKDFPKQDIKPMINDPECYTLLTELAGPSVEVISLKSLAYRRTKYFKTFHTEYFFK